MDTAFEILADQHRLMLLCYARSLLHGNDHDVEDVVQETLMTAHARLDQFRSGGNFGSWLRGIARNKVLESHRATRARPAIVDHRILQGIEDVYAMFDATTLGEERWLERVRRLLQGRMANPWTRVAVLGAALAASLALGVVVWTMTRPAVLPAGREVVRKEPPGSKPRPEPNQPSRPPEAHFVPFAASSGTVESPHDLPPQNTGQSMIELLAAHETLAVFEGLKYRVCSGPTPPCPLQCDHSGEFATFQIRKYLTYASPSPYGDPKQKAFVARLSDHDKKPVADPQILRTARGWRIGDYVLLTWEHRQLTTDGVSSPERLVAKLEGISREKAEAMLTSEKRTQERNK